MVFIPQYSSFTSGSGLIIMKDQGYIYKIQFPSPKHIDTQMSPAVNEEKNNNLT